MNPFLSDKEIFWCMAVEMLPQIPKYWDLTDSWWAFGYDLITELVFS